MHWRKVTDGKRGTGWEDFRRAVPIRTYEKLEPWINAMADGEENVLTAEPAVAFERTLQSHCTVDGVVIGHTQNVDASFSN